MNEMVDGRVPVLELTGRIRPPELRGRDTHFPLGLALVALGPLLRGEADDRRRGRVRASFGHDSSIRARRKVNLWEKLNKLLFEAVQKQFRLRRVRQGFDPFDDALLGGHGPKCSSGGAASLVLRSFLLARLIR